MVFSTAGSEFVLSDNTILPTSNWMEDNHNTRYANTHGEKEKEENDMYGPHGEN